MHAYEEAADYRVSRRATAQFVLWLVAWLATLAAARFGPELLWDPQRQPVWSWIVIVVNVLVGLAWIVAFMRFLRALDDLQRKIMLDALGVTLGVGWVVGFGWFLADAAGLIAYDVNIAVFPAFLGIVFVIAFFVGRIRYR